MILGILICISYAIVAFNTRAIAKAQYFSAATSGALFMVVNFLVIRHIVEVDRLDQFLWYLAGGVAGDLLGIWLSKWFENRDKAPKTLIIDPTTHTHQSEMVSTERQ